MRVHSSSWSLGYRSEFKQAVRVFKVGFMDRPQPIKDNSVFQNNITLPQLSVAYKLALNLVRLGWNGNGASIGRSRKNLAVARGTLVKFTRRVLEAILPLRKNYIKWPSTERRAEILAVMACKRFPNCVGSVDGTTIPLHQCLDKDGGSFYDRKQILNQRVNCLWLWQIDNGDIHWLASFMCRWWRIQ